MADDGKASDEDALALAGVEAAAKGWGFRVVVSADLAGAGPRFKDTSEGFGAEGGEVFQKQVRKFIHTALGETGAEEGVWRWTGDGAMLAFPDANRAHDFAVALHLVADIHNRKATTPEAQRHFRVGMAATDDPVRESWDYTVMRAVRLESQADTDGVLVDVDTWAGLHSTNRGLYGPEEQVQGKRDDESYAARRHTPAVAVTAAAVPPDSPQNLRLHNLPPDIAHFKGRDAVETALLNGLQRDGGTQAISALKGIGGIGKSALAVRVAHQLSTHYPAAQILVNLRGTDADPLPPRAAMEDVIRRFDPDAPLPNDDEAVAELYRDLLTQHKSLLILDNARDNAQILLLLPPSPSAAIITSRRQLDSPHIISHGLDNLERAESIALLADIFADRAPAKTPDATALDRLAAACVDHPLALTVAGIYTANHADRITVQRYVEQIMARRDTLKLDGMADHDVMDSLAFSLERLSEEDASLAERWRDLAVFPADFDAAAAAAVWADDSGAEESGANGAYAILAGLADAGFLEPGNELERFRLHDLMRDLARLGQGEDRFAESSARHAAHFVTVLSAADELYLKGGAENVLSGLALYDREAASIRTGQVRAVTAMMETPSAATGSLVFDYAATGAYVLSLRLHPRYGILWWRDAAKGARLSQNRHGEGGALGNLGNAHADLGEIDKAIDYYEQRIVIAREIGDRRGEGAALGNLGNAYAALGETDKAIDYHEQQLVITREIGDRRMEGNALGNLGIGYKNLGEIDKAIDYHEQQLVIVREIGDRRSEGATLGNLGTAHAALAEIGKAIDYYEQRIVIAREMGDRRGEGAVLGNLGNAHAALGDIDKAIDYYEQRIVIAREIGDRRGEGNSLGNLGIAYQKLGEIDKAIDYYEQRIVIAREIGDRRGEGNSLGNLGTAYVTLERFAEAREAWTAALVIFGAIGNPNAETVREWLAALEK